MRTASAPQPPSIIAESSRQPHVAPSTFTPNELDVLFNTALKPWTAVDKDAVRPSDEDSHRTSSIHGYDVRAAQIERDRSGSHSGENRESSCGNAQGFFHPGLLLGSRRHVCLVTYDQRVCKA